MTKAKLAILEKAFGAEVENRLPFQSKSKLATSLWADGYLKSMTVHFGNVSVEGWQLTHLGRYTYCETCK